MDKNEYRAYLQSDEWKALADDRRALDNNTCWICGRKGEKFPVHHLYYEQNLSNTFLAQLRTVCPQCHKAIHDSLDRHKSDIENLRIEYNKLAAELLKDIDKDFTQKRAEVVAQTAKEMIGDNNPKGNTNGILAYVSDTLKAGTVMHSNLYLYHRDSLNAYPIAQQILKKMRGR